VAAVVGTQGFIVVPAQGRIGRCAAFTRRLIRSFISRMEESTRCLSRRMSGEVELSSRPSRSSASAIKSLNVLKVSVTAKRADG
jgi:hypothetical protein